MEGRLKSPEVRSASGADESLSQIELLAAEAIRLTTEHSDGAAAADRLISALKRLPPTEETANLLQRLLDGKTLDSVQDSTGSSCRFALIEAQISLGFPHALKVDPDDLEQLNERRQQPTGWRNLATGAGILSLLWNGGWALLGTSVALGDNKPEILLLAAPFWIALGHAVAAIAARFRPPSRRLYTVLGLMFFVGPIASAIVAYNNSLFGFALMFAAPAMLTALLCAVAAWRETKPSRDDP